MLDKLHPRLSNDTIDNNQICREPVAVRMAGLQGSFQANHLGAHLDAKPPLTQQSSRPKAGFMKPFKIYENFRSAVYRGVRKNSSSVYEVSSILFIIQALNFGSNI